MESSNKRFWIIAVVLMLVVGVWVFSPTEVTVTGVGTVSVPAEMASFSVTMVSNQESASASLSNLREKVDKVKSLLGEVGIGSNNITETQVTITPAIVNNENASGFQASSTLTIKTKNVAMTGEMIVNMYGSGAAIVSQPVVSIESDRITELEKEALDLALDDAKKNIKTTLGFRPFKKIVKIEQASSGNAATSTRIVEDNKGAFEVAKAVNVTYRVW